MNGQLRFLVVFLLLLPTAGQLRAQDQEQKDTPYFSGMPNYCVYDGEDIEFDSYNYFNGRDCATVEGRKFKRTYTLKEEARQSSVIQIMRNYANALRSMGGTVVYEGMPQEAECAEHNGINMLIGKVLKDGNELWIEVATLGGEEYYLTLVARELMKQDIQANDMLNTLNREGRIALYIHFDTGKARVKPESQPIIDQIVQMMKSNPELKIGVEGHTDNVGGPAANKTLSEERAKSVVSAIVGQGIAAERLSPAGFGQDIPIGDNATEEGRAKNRRVELVKK